MLVLEALPDQLLAREHGQLGQEVISVHALPPCVPASRLQ